MVAILSIIKILPYKGYNMYYNGKLEKPVNQEWQDQSTYFDNHYQLHALHLAAKHSAKTIISVMTYKPKDVSYKAFAVSARSYASQYTDFNKWHIGKQAAKRFYLKTSRQEWQKFIEAVKNPKEPSLDWQEFEESLNIDQKQQINSLLAELYDYAMSIWGFKVTGDFVNTDGHIVRAFISEDITEILDEWIHDNITDVNYPVEYYNDCGLIMAWYVQLQELIQNELADAFYRGLQRVENHVANYHSDTLEIIMSHDYLLSVIRENGIKISSSSDNVGETSVGKFYANMHYETTEYDNDLDHLSCPQIEVIAS